MPIVSTMPIFSAISIILLVANSDANKTPDSAKISAQFLVGVLCPLSKATMALS